MKKLQDMTDEELALSYVDGNNRAFDLLLSRNQSKLFSYILFVVHDRETAEDLFQETFVKAIVRLQDGSYTVSGKFGAWMMRIAHNVVMGRPEKADKDIEDESLDQLYNNVDISKLTDELNLIRTDGVLRLMVSEYNGKKSNSTAYDKIIKIKGKEEYLGLLGEALLDDETIYLYQRLNERDAKTRASREEPKGTKVKISKKIINLI